MKRKFYSEIAFILGIIFLELGIALTAKANFGMSMVAAPAYVLHKSISSYWLWFSFGIAQYAVQAVLIITLMIVVRKVKVIYFLSFLTCLIDGFILDLFVYLVGFIPEFGLIGRIIYYIVGIISTALGVAFFFKTYFASEVYDLFVKELSERFSWNISKVKTIYDISSAIVAIILSFSLFGFMKFEGIQWGTVVCALINGTIIGLFTKFFNKYFEFVDLFKFKKLFER